MKNTLPTYAIVELLIRLSHINPLIGDYKGHAFNEDGVIVKTKHGSIAFSKSLIKQQFDNPEMISDDELTIIASTFNSLKQQKLSNRS